MAKMSEPSGLPYSSATKVPDGTYEQDARTNATNARFHAQGSNRLVPNTSVPVDNRIRIKVACINWSHSEAPHATAYIIINGEIRVETYCDTWDEAMVKACEWAKRYVRKGISVSGSSVVVS